MAVCYFCPVLRDARAHFPASAQDAEHSHSRTSNVTFGFQPKVLWALLLSP